MKGVVGGCQLNFVVGGLGAHSAEGRICTGAAISGGRIREGAVEVKIPRIAAVGVGVTGRGLGGYQEKDCVCVGKISVNGGQFCGGGSKRELRRSRESLRCTAEWEADGSSCDAGNWLVIGDEIAEPWRARAVVGVSEKGSRGSARGTGQGEAVDSSEATEEERGEFVGAMATWEVVEGEFTSLRVAVIGAGAAGLSAARELVKEGHGVVVYEESLDVGGQWLFDPRVESDPLGVDPLRTRVNCSMYSTLRTNLPRELMGYLDYPFLSKEGRDCRRYPGHEEVGLYLKDFAEDHNLRELIRFGVKVEYVGMKSVQSAEKIGATAAPKENKSNCGEAAIQWVVQSRQVSDAKVQEAKERCHRQSGSEVEAFDAVVICNGHFSEPRIAEIPGVESWPGVHMHSHNYRVPDPFKNQVIVVIGNSNSGADISKELAQVARKVYFCARSWTSDQLSKTGEGAQHNLWKRPLVERAFEDGTVKFLDGTSSVVDIIMHCTGYLYSFPFLDTKGFVSVEDNRVGPLYKHVFPPTLAPTLSFVGLPWKVVPFQLIQLQTMWISKVLSRRVKLLSDSEMMAEVESFYNELEVKGIPKNRTHMLHLGQFDYCQWLADQCACGIFEAWRKEIYLGVSQNRSINPDSYRDSWSDQALLEVAMASLIKQSTRYLSVK